MIDLGRVSAQNASRFGAMAMNGDSIVRDPFDMGLR